MKSNNRVWAIIVIAATVIFLLSGCISQHIEEFYPIPEEGTWYCELLQVHITFGMDRRTEIPLTCYAVIEGDSIECAVRSQHGTPFVFLYCMDSSNPYYELGETIYWWELVEVSESEMILADYHTQETFQFVRTD